MNPVRDGYATATRTRCCVICDNEIIGRTDKQWCSTRCRQQAWRRAKATPVTPTVVPRSEIVYACPNCDARYLGEQRCPECNLWCRRIGPGGPCPHCDEPVAVQDVAPTDRHDTQPSNRDPKNVINAPHKRHRSAMTVTP